MIDIIDNDVAFQKVLAPIVAKGKDRDKLDSLIKETLYASQSIIRIDVNDIRDLFEEGGGMVYALDVSVDAADSHRMKRVMEQVKKELNATPNNNHYLFYFFYPKNLPLMMDELNLFVQWLEGISDDYHIIWGLANHASQTLRTIVVSQESFTM